MSRLFIARLVIGLPPLALAVQALSWLRWGIDIPFLDDWRAFIMGDAGSFAVWDLFRPANDTIYATGKLLDALAVKLLSYNSVAYQFISLVFSLGLLLYLQYLLLRNSFQSRTIVCVAFLGTLFSLQPGGYWGLQNNAFHQIIPLLTLLASFCVIFLTRWRPASRIAAISFLGIVSGCAYISGAFTVTAAAVVSLVFSLRADADSARLLRQGAYGFALAAVITLPMQLWAIFFYQGAIYDLRATPWAYPWEWEFWIYLLGVFSRAFDIPPIRPQLWISLAATLFLFVLMLLPALGGLVALLKRPVMALDELRAPYIYVTLTAVIGAYLMIVAAGRAPLDANPVYGWQDYFLRGRARFHFFWITLLIPWTIAVYLVWFRKWSPIGTKVLPVATAGVMLIYLGMSGSFSYGDAFRRDVHERREIGVWCLQEKLHRNERLICQTLHTDDLTDAVSLARRIGTSFVRYFHFPPRPVEALMDQIEDDSVVREANGTLTINAGFDPQLYFRFGEEDAALVQGCLRMSVTGSVRSTASDYIQLFYRTPEAEHYSQEQSVIIPYPGGEAFPFSMMIKSESGFLPEMRIDPGEGGKTYQLESLSFACH